jgi:hypothetical protein
MLDHVHDRPGHRAAGARECERGGCRGRGEKQQSIHGSSSLLGGSILFDPARDSWDEATAATISVQAG